MPAWKGVFYFVLFFLCFAFSASAQQADFTPDKTSGCSPLTVSFLNASTGFSSNATYSWDFGNTNSSALQNPGTTYNEEGTYTVTLTVTQGTIQSSKSKQITVYKKPVVSFSVDVTKGCAPFGVTFTSNSQAGDGNISTYVWDFGDGIAQTGSNPQTHTYTLSGLITPSLTVTNSYGCFSTTPIPQLINVLPQVIASFKPNKTVLCKVTDAASFTNTSAGIGALYYHWDFGDGDTSAAQQPKHVYKQRGVYKVKLTTTSADGCIADTTLVTDLNVADFHTQFTLPSLICQNTAATFADSSTPLATTENWRINGTTSADTSARQLHHSFTSAGTYKIQLVNVYETCPDTATKTITVQPASVVSGFVAKPEATCGAPVTVDFIDTSKTNVGWLWDFGDGGASGKTATHFYNANGTYNVSLTVTGANGCTATTNQPLVVQKENVSIKSSTGSLGCDNKTTVFSAVTNAGITSYNWSFGDGSPSSTDSTPQHTYNTIGEYTVVLNYTTASGCTDTAHYTIDVFKKPHFNIAAVSGTTVCGSNLVSFAVTGDHDGTNHWNFGDGSFIDSIPPPYFHRYEYDSTYTVSLIINNNGCADTATRPNYITVLPPFPHITGTTNTCSGTRGLVTFYEASRKALTYSWDFGDGSAHYVYTTPPPQVQHEYKATGYYRVALTVTNGSCQASDSFAVNVLLKQHPLLSVTNQTLCSNDTLHTTLSQLDGNPVSYPTALGYAINTIQYNDGNPFAGNANKIENTLQNSFSIGLNNLDVNEDSLRMITTSYGFLCQDTSNYIVFKALGPVAAFSVNNNVCFKTPVVFTDKSKSSHNSPIVKWQWQFGDSAAQTNVQSTSVSHRYATPGNYYATLTVTDANSCSSSTLFDSGIIAIAGPRAAFSVSQNPVIPNMLVSFYNQTDVTNTTLSNNLYTWNFGDGSGLPNQPYADSVSHIYQKEKIDTVVLIAANAAEQCADTASQVVYVQNPNLSFTYTTAYVNPNSGCPPVIASFVNTSLNTTTVSWNFGDSTTANNINNAGHIYNKPGIYKVTLYGYFIDGSIDSVFQWITIKGPYAVLKAVKPFACGSELITLQAIGSNTKQFGWDFGDGTLLNNNDTSASHRYLTPGVYTPSLIVKDSSNCQFPFFLTQPIIVDTLHLHINLNAQIACDSSLLTFKPAIVSEAKTLGYPLTYHWNFGTGILKDTASTETASFIYNKPGKYEVILSGASQFGCTDVTSDSVTVQPTPRAYIAGPTQICQGDSATFTGASTRTVSWYWQLPNGDTSTRQITPSQTFIVPGVDSLSLVVNDHGCYDTAWHLLTVNANPVINPSPISAHLCEGDSVQLQAHDGTLYNWFPKQHISASNIATPFVFPDTATTYFVQVKNAAGCVSNDSISISVTKRFIIKTPSPVYICPNGIAQLNASGADKYQWLNNEVSNPNIANPTVSTYSSQTYTVVGFDNDGCFADTATTQVLTATLPTVNAGADITTFAGEPVTLAATGSADIVHWQWMPDRFLNCDTCATVISTPHTDIQYIIKATNNRGCVNFDTLQVAILCKGSLINAPSAFTPNGDGNNDRFTVLGSGIREVKHFAVFNRLGEMLYEKEHLTISETTFEGWDGTYKNVPAPPGTYVFYADIVCDTGELFHYKGTVVLIR